VRHDLRRNMQHGTAGLGTVFKTDSLDQRFSTSGTRTAGGTRRIVWWYARTLDYHLFHYLFLKMLISLLKSF
jgi:hypothetical protein